MTPRLIRVGVGGWDAATRVANALACDSWQIVGCADTHRDAPAEVQRTAYQTAAP